jgi:hypothetical protein
MSLSAVRRISTQAIIVELVSRGVELIARV